VHSREEVGSGLPQPHLFVRQAGQLLQLFERAIERSASFFWLGGQLLRDRADRSRSRALTAVPERSSGSLWVRGSRN